MTLIIISVAYIRRVGLVRNRLRIDFINTRDISDLSGNKCLFIDRMSVIFIRIYVISTGLYVILIRERAQIVYKSEEELRPASSQYG